MMLDEVQRRNYSQGSTCFYLRRVEGFLRRFNCASDRLGPRPIREYETELFQKQKVSPGTLARRLRLYVSTTSRLATSIRSRRKQNDKLVEPELRMIPFI